MQSDSRPLGSSWSSHQEGARFSGHPSAFIHTVLEKGDLVYDGTSMAAPG
jgi:hypothetical protein